MIYDNFAGRLADLDGRTIGVAAMTAAYTPITTDTTINALTGEATGTGYARQTFTCTVDNDTCLIADADHWPTINTSALAAPMVRLVYYLHDGSADDLKVISEQLYGEQTPDPAWTVEPVNGFARTTRTPTLPNPAGTAAGLVPTTDGDDNYHLTNASTVDPTEGTTGQVLTTNGTAATWQDAAGGGTYGAWNDLLDAPADATLPGWVNPLTLGLQPGARWRTTPTGQVEFGGAAGWLDDITPTPGAPGTLPSALCTLPPEARPIDKPIITGTAWDVFGTGEEALIHVEVNPSTGVVTVDGAAMTTPVALIRYLTWDIA